MGQRHETAAAALIQSLNDQAQEPMARMPLRLLVYLVDEGYTDPQAMPRIELQLVAARWKRALKSLEDAMRNLVRVGAVFERVNSRGVVHYSYNPDWRPKPKEPTP